MAAASRLISTLREDSSFHENGVPQGRPLPAYSASTKSLASLAVLKTPRSRSGVMLSRPYESAARLRPSSAAVDRDSVLMSKSGSTQRPLTAGMSKRESKRESVALALIVRSQQRSAETAKELSLKRMEAMQKSTTFVDASFAERTVDGSSVLYSSWRDDSLFDSCHGASRSEFAVSKQQLGVRIAQHTQLTTRVVPYDKDYTTNYCGACEFEQQARCTYCHMSKLARARRMPLAKLARQLLVLQPAITALEITRELGKYATSDEAAQKTNETIGGFWAEAQAAMCLPHERDAAEKEEAERLRREELDGLRREVEEGKATILKRDAEIARLLKALHTEEDNEEGMRTRLRKLEQERDSMLREHEELLMLHEATLEELEDTRLEIQGHETHTRGTQTSARAESHIVVQTQTDDLVMMTPEEMNTLQETLSHYRRRQQQQEDKKKKTTRAESKHFHHHHYHDDKEDDASQAAERSDPYGEDVGSPPPSGAKAASVRFSPSTVDEEEEEASEEEEEEEETNPPSKKGRRKSVQMKRNKSRKKKVPKVKVVPKSERIKYSPLNFLPGDCELTNKGVSHLLHSIYEIYEKKLLFDDRIYAAGQRPDPICRGLRSFWRQKLGIKKMAIKRMNEMVSACRTYGPQSSRVAQFAWVLGLDVSKMTAHEAPFWSPQLSRTFFYTYWKCLKNPAMKAGNLTEYFQRHVEGNSLIEREHFINALMGKDDALDQIGVNRADIRTWRNPELTLVFNDEEINRLLTTIEDLPTKQGAVYRSIDLDEAMLVVLEQASDALRRHADQLTAQFFEFDMNQPGLSIEEFSKLCVYALGAERYTVEQRNRLHEDIEDLCDDDDDETIGSIDNGSSFAVACMSVESDLAYSSLCRYHWSS